MRAMRPRLLVCLILGLAACGDDDGSATPDGPPDAGPPAPDAIESGFRGPDDVCPGSDHCNGTGDGKLYVGVGKAVYSPTITETWTDVNENSNYDSGEPYVDADGDGEFDAYWLFGGGRPAIGVASDVEARALVFEQNDLRFAIVYLDAIGLLAGDMQMIRDDPALAALDLDHVMIGSIHAHDSPDTVGIWGETALSSGYNPEYMEVVRGAAVDAVVQAVGSLAEAEAIIATGLLLNDPDDPTSLTDNWNQDIRDPIIFDPTLTVARFVRADDPDTTIGTFVNWANHPEVSAFGDEDLLISSHYVHWLRQVIEDGVAADEAGKPALPGVGGITVFVQGALGGQIGSLRGTHPIGPDGEPVTEASHYFEQVLGTNIGRRALEFLADDGDVVGDFDLSFRSAEMFARVDNIGFQTYFLIGALAPHDLVGYDPDEPVGPGNEPWIPLRTTFAQIGPIGIATAPGELHPELWVGGYDGSWSWGWPILDPEETINVPDLDDAPAPPYLRDLVLANDGVEYPILAGLAEDYCGYLVPAYNYVLHPDNPYIEEAEGDHYEEVYSLGPEVEAHVVHPIYGLVEWRAP
jgi:hypothetical protein